MGLYILKIWISYFSWHIERPIFPCWRSWQELRMLPSFGEIFIHQFFTLLQASLCQQRAGNVIAGSYNVIAHWRHRDFCWGCEGEINRNAKTGWSKKHLSQILKNQNFKRLRWKKAFSVDELMEGRAQQLASMDSADRDAESKMVLL